MKTLFRILTPLLLISCVNDGSDAPKVSACLFRLNGEIFDDSAAGFGGSGGETGEEDETIDFADILAACNYRTVFLQNQFDGGAPEPFHITPECTAILRQAIKWDEPTFAGALGAKARANGIRGIHAAFFQPLVLPIDQMILKYSGDEHEMAELNLDQFGAYPADGEHTLTTSYFNEQVVRDFCGNVDIIEFKNEGGAIAKIVNHRMTLLEAIPGYDDNEGDKHLLGRILYHEGMHFVGGHVTCNDDILDSAAGNEGACDSDYDKTYHVDAGWSAAAAIGGLVYRVDGDPVLSRESMRALLVSACKTFTVRVNPVRTLYMGAVDCDAKADQVLSEYLAGMPADWPGVPGGLPCDRGPVRGDQPEGCGGHDGGDDTGTGTGPDLDPDTTGTGGVDETGPAADTTG